MKKNVKTGGTAKKNKATANVDCQLSYVVTFDITHADKDGVHTLIKSTETRFNEKIALNSRRMAFALRNSLSKDSYIDGKLCDGHLDSPLEAKLKNYRDINMLTLNIHCIDNDDDFLTINTNEAIAPNRDDLNALNDEYGWYLHYGYDTGGDPNLVEDEDGYQNKIINFANNETSDGFFCIGQSEMIDEIQRKGIEADSNGNLFLITRKEVVDNLVQTQYHHGGKYALIEVSPRGITGVIKPYFTGEYAAFNERIVQQEKIEPQFIKNIEVADSREKKYYHDYDGMDRKLHPERYAATESIINQVVPFSFIVSVVRNDIDEYAATLGGNLAFLGYTVRNPEILYSRFLTMTKAEVLANDPRITNNGKAYIQVHLWDEKMWKSYLIFDSRGFTKKILKNLKKEIRLLSNYIQGEQDLTALQDADGSVVRCIRSRWTTPDVDPSFLAPIPEGYILIDASDHTKMSRMADVQKQDASAGVNWSYTPYNYDLFKSKDVA